MNAQEDLDISLHDPIVVSSFYRVGVETIVREREIKKYFSRTLLNYSELLCFSPPRNTLSKCGCV